jgi:hypothetical protein
MRTALLAATALVALSPLAVAQNQIDAATEAIPKAKPINPNTVDPTKAKGRLHYDVPCRVSSVGTCITEPPTYPPHKLRP